MIKQIITKDTDTDSHHAKIFSCKGDAQSSSHPLVYLNLGDKTSIKCPYCDRKFSIEKNLRYANNKITKK